MHISNLHQKNPLSSEYVVDLDAFEVNPCPGDINKCRAYAYVELNDANNYTAVGGNLSYASPQIRDGGLSYAVFWMHLQNSGIEVGWAKDTGNNGNPYLYWGYYNPGWHFHKIADNTTAHTIELAHLSATNRWHVFIDGVQAKNAGNDPTEPGKEASVSLPDNSGYIQVGGEVSDLSTSVHNEMGTANFTGLRFQQNHSQWKAWTNWNYKHNDYSYRAWGFGTDAFQICGYECPIGGGGTSRTAGALRAR